MENYTVKEQEIQSENNAEDLKQILLKYFRYWPWFVGAIVVSITLAFLYNRYATNIYETHSQIKILKEQESGIDLSGLQGASPLFDLNKVNLDNEMEILKSRRLLSKVVNNLGLTIRYYQEGNIKTNELWGDQVPFKVQWAAEDTLANETEEYPPNFKLNFTTTTKFQISLTDSGNFLEGVSFGELVNIEGYRFVVLPNKKYSGNIINGNYAFDYSDEDKVINRLSTNIKIAPVGDKSEILTISISGQNPLKNEAIVDELVQQFDEDGINDKRLISKRTGDFVQERLKILVGELDTVETGLVNYKQNQNLITIESDATQLYTKEAEAESKRFEFENQKAITQAFLAELKKGNEYDLLPANLGIRNESINNLTDSYNQLVLDRQKLLVSSTQENPMIIHLEDKLRQLRGNIIESVNSYLNSIEISLANFKTRENNTSGELGKLPEKEKGIRSIKRQQEIKEKLYLFLLQKREEAALQYATTSPTIKVVDYAYTQPIPVAPKKQIIYLAALILGGLVPFGVLYVKFLLDTRINSKEEVKKTLKNIPIIAEVPQVDKYQTSVLKANDRSVIAEAFRILRTNMSYFRPPNLKQEDGQVIYVTSSTKGEGKTFTSINLASSLASTNKKVLLLGCDLRNPQLHNYVEKGKNTLGVTSFLYDNTITFEEMVIPEVLGIKNLDIVLSGHLPPNPAELLMNGRFEQIIEKAKKKYDYVIVDTAPTVLVTDTLLISQWADITVYVVKAHFTESKLLQHIKEVYEDKKLKNLGIVLNGVDEKGGYGYNYGYGYGYGADTINRKWWKLWRK